MKYNLWFILIENNLRFNFYLTKNCNVFCAVNCNIRLFCVAVFGVAADSVLDWVSGRNSRLHSSQWSGNDAEDNFEQYNVRILHQTGHQTYLGYCTTWGKNSAIFKRSTLFLIVLYIMNNELINYKFLINQAECCGMNGPEDWNSVNRNNSLPHTCCPDSKDDGSCKLTTPNKYTDSCVEKFKKNLEHYGGIIGGVGIGIAFSQVLLLLLL